MFTLRRILVPVDFSPCSKAAVSYACFLAERFDAAVDVLHVWQTPDYTSPEQLVQVPGETQHTLASLARRKAEVAMEGFLADLKTPVKLASRFESGDAYSTILNFAVEGWYDLVVMGTHGRTGLSHLVMGSVAEKVARSAPCPVLSVRAPERSIAHEVPSTRGAKASPDKAGQG
jgi:nucleotide-binding universal stress UspA family protein